jgi:hypothetical protein
VGEAIVASEVKVDGKEGVGSVSVVSEDVGDGDDIVLKGDMLSLDK